MTKSQKMIVIQWILTNKKISLFLKKKKNIVTDYFFVISSLYKQKMGKEKKELNDDKN